MSKVVKKRLNVSDVVTYIDINIVYGELYIEKGENFSLEIKCTERHEVFAAEKQNRLSIWSDPLKKQMHITQKHTDPIIVKMIIPEGKKFKKVHLKIGAVVLDVEALITDSLVVKKGAGQVQIAYLEASNFAKIEAAVGEVCIEDGTIHNLSMHLGVGAVLVQAKLTGNAEIQTGVGELDLELLGNPNDYSVTVNKGVGSCSVDKLNYVSRNTYGDGPNHLKVKGGVGEINVSFSED